MPFKKISDLPTGTAQGGELIPATQSGVTRTLTLGRQKGQIPYIGDGGFFVFRERSWMVSPAELQIPAGSSGWARLCTVVLPVYGGVRFMARLDQTGGGNTGAVLLHVVAWRASSTISSMYIGLEPAHTYFVSPSITDAAIIETAEGVFEVWIKLYGAPGFNFPITYHAFGSNDGPITFTEGLFSGGDLPSPAPGRSMVQWSTSTSSRIHSGRIVEAGSGSNGSYIRFSDGTQIAQHTIPSSSFDSELGGGTFTIPYWRSVTWAYPAAFAATPVVQATAESTVTGIMVARVTSRSATSAGIRVEYAASNAAFTVNLLAIGRWY